MKTRVIATMVSLLLGSAALLPAQKEKEKKKECSAEVSVCVREMAEYHRNKGWVGIKYDLDEESGEVVLQQVIPDSPAAAAGLREGDVFVTLNGVPFTRDRELELREIYKESRPGDTLVYDISRDGRRLEIEVRLGRIPDHILALWVGQHVLEAHSAPPEQTASKKP